MSLAIKEKSIVKKIFRQIDYNRFAQISGDDNLTHVDPDFAATTRFGKTLAHGMQLYSYICRLLSTQLPGPGTLQISQELKFPWGVYVGDEIKFEVETLEVDQKSNTSILKTTCTTPEANALEGTTKVLLPGPGKIVFPGVDTNMGKYEASEGDKLHNMVLGQEAKAVRTFTQEDIENYASLTGDQNPLCLDKDYALKKGLKGTLVPGALLNGMFSMLLGTKLPGKGTNWLKHNIYYPNPAYVGEEITALVKIVRIRPDKQLVNLYDTCITKEGKIVCQAESLVLAKEMAG